MAQKQLKEYKTYFIVLKQSLGKDDDGKSLGVGDFKFAWRAPVDTYPKEIAKALGIQIVDDKKPEKSLIFGANSPRPARIRINVKYPKGKTKSFLLFAKTEKVPGLVVGSVLRNKKYKNGTITTVSLPGTSTNPSRSKDKKKKPKPKPKPKR